MALRVLEDPRVEQAQDHLKWLEIHLLLRSRPQLQEIFGSWPPTLGKVKHSSTLFV